MSTQPLITDQMKRALQAQAALTPPPVPSMSMAQPMQPLPMPAPVQVANVPNAIDNTNRRLLSDQGELRRLQTSGSGIDQITKPVDASGNPTGQPVSGLRKFGGVLARIGDAALSVVSPGAAALTPGTSLHHRLLLNQNAGMVNNDLANQKEQQQTEEEKALTDYTLQRPDIEQSKIDQRQTAVQERVGQAAAARGQTVSWDANGLPSFQDDVTSQAYADHQALNAMHQATADKAKIQADIAQNHYIPGTPEFTEAQRKLAQVDKRLGVAMASLGLRAQNLDLRKQTVNAALYGKDNQGNYLPGTPMIEDGNGELTGIGQKNASTAIKQQKNVTSFNDLSGSVQHLRQAIKAYEGEGGDMSDARLAQAASDPTSVIGKVINGKLVTGGLSPAAIDLLNAQRQTMEQAGILRSTTGGTSSEAGAQRILQVVPQFGVDTNKSAYNKLDEQEGVLKRLAPGQTRVVGGASVKNSSAGKPGTQAFTDGGVTYHIPAGQVAEFKKDHPNAR